MQAALHAAAMRFRRTLNGVVRRGAAALLALAVLTLAACGGRSDERPVSVAISIQPADVGVVEGTAATFSVTVSGSGPIVYQWSSSSDGGTSYTDIAGAINPIYTIPAATAAQNGLRLRVAVTNSQGTVVSSAITLTVSRAVVVPAISVQPANVTVTAPDTARFAVTVTGTTPTFVWQSSSDGITWTAVPSAANGPTFDLAATSVTMNGQRYRVVASNASGSVTSAAVLLTVNPTPIAPAFTTQPTALTTSAGLGATFSVVASGTPMPSVQWRLNGTDIADGPLSGACSGAIASGATTDTLTLSSVPIGCSGASLTAVASNGVNAPVTSTAAILTVGPALAAPLLTTQPASLTVTAGATATFTAAASGVPTPSVQWQLSADGGTSFANITGATAASYTTPATALADSGKKYRAVFSNGSGTATSSAATLTVGAAPVPPVLTMQPSSASVTAPASATFSATATGTPVPTVQWQVSSDDGATYTNIPTATATSYTTPATSTADNGKKYRAIFSNALGDATSIAATLTVAAAPAAPTVSTQPRSVTVIAGQPATFSADATGVPAPSVQWQASTDGGATFADIAGATSFTYTTPALAVSDSGKKYRAVFSNASGSAASTAGTLTVTPAPVAPAIVTQPSDLVITAPAMATFTATATGTPTPAVQWQVSTNGAVFTNIVGANDTSYTTPPTTAALTGNKYRAVFGNATGTATSSAATLTVYPGPGELGILAGQVGVGGGTADGTYTDARFDQPRGLAADAAGNVYVADRAANTIRKITPARVVTTLAGLVYSAGSADGTGNAARFRNPFSLAVGATGNVYVLDGYNYTVRMVTPGGVVTTVAGTAGVSGYADGAGFTARFSEAYGIAVDAASNVYVADTNSMLIRKISPTSVVSTLAGIRDGFCHSDDGTGSNGRFCFPFGIATDTSGNLYVADTSNHTIRKVTAGGSVTTLAGLAGSPGSADGTGAAARFNTPQSLTVDPAGNVFVADYTNCTIRKITPAGVVTTVVGAAGACSLQLGTTPRLTRPDSVAFVAPNRLAISTASTVFTYTLP